MILVLLPAGHDGVGEPVVHPFAPRPGHVRHRAIEHRPSRRICVVAAIDEIAQAAAGLRAAPAIRFFHAEQRIRIGPVVFQEADEIPHRHVPDSHDLRIFRCIDQLVNPAWVEPGGVVNVPVRGCHRELGLFGFGPGTRMRQCEGPLVARNYFGGIVRIPTPGERGVRRIHRCGAIRVRRDPPAQRMAHRAGSVRNELDAHPTGNRPAVVGCYRHVQHHPVVAGEHIALPRQPGHRVAAAHQEPIAGVGQRQRIVAVRGVVKELQRAFVAPVAVVVKDPSVAPRGVGRPQNHEIGGEMHQPLGIPGCQLQVHHIRLRRSQRVHPEQRSAGQAFIRTGVSERATTREGPAVSDFQLDHGRLPGTQGECARPHVAPASPLRTPSATRRTSAAGNGATTV